MESHATSLPAIAEDSYQTNAKIDVNEDGHAVRTARRRKPAKQSQASTLSIEEHLAWRRSLLPEIRYPDLPITERREELLAAIRDNQVVVVAGETGSGKSTQIPKFCLELGRGIGAMIGHTQPRRLAARTIAERVAEELGNTVGSTVGYAVRFNDRVTDETLIKVMTDGILLAEIRRDRLLRAYDTIIVDEAHERSLNIDFLLGYLHQLLPKRPDLKVIITSATIDTERFANHFSRPGGPPVPIVTVEGRTYPVEVRYRPFGEAPDDDRDQTQAIVESVKELSAAGTGDILVFLSGEREIKDATDALRSLDTKDLEILPLYARLSSREQHRVFEAHTGRRVVLSTNVAETSLTVPGVRYVIDTGTARISRYSRRLKVQRLPIEAISQASANQRSGRCGRVAPGIAIRLYTEEDFLGRDEFTDPEILRTNLASVILQMRALGLGDMADFPFVEPPDRRSVKDGIALLEELGALDPEPPKTDDASHAPQDANALTPLGRRLARLPLDPRLGRMVLEAERNGCVREVMVIAAALSIQDPFERPADQREAAAASHARFKDEQSDFITTLNLWNYLREKQRELSSNQFRRMCRAEFLHYVRIREWQDVFSQLKEISHDLGITASSEAAVPDRIHLSLLSGLLSHVGLRDDDTRDYRGVRNARFAIAPGSTLAKKTARWVMAGELVETNRLWGRMAARIQPEWIERSGEHLLQHRYSEPRWDHERGSAVATHAASMLGLPIISGRKASLSKINPDLAHELFIRHALVQGEWQSRHSFVEANTALAERLKAWEDRLRRRDIFVGDDALFAFYEARVPTHVMSTTDFDRWWRNTSPLFPELLNLTEEALLAGVEIRPSDYPDRWMVDGSKHGFAVTYKYEPGAPDDGASVQIPLTLLNQVDPIQFLWQVPGMRVELVSELLRALPKPLRRVLVPVPDRAEEFLAAHHPKDGALLDLLAKFVTRATGSLVSRDDWNPTALPPYVRITFKVVDSGRVIAYGKDLELLTERLAPRAKAAVANAAPHLVQTGLTDWTIGTLPRRLETQRGGVTVTAYPSLVDDKTSVAVRILSTESEQQLEMWDGLRRLLVLSSSVPLKSVQRDLATRRSLALALGRHGTTDSVAADCLSSAIDHLMVQHGAPCWDDAGFAALHKAVNQDLRSTLAQAIEHVSSALTRANALEMRLSDLTSLAVAPAVADLRAQLARLVGPGFITRTGLTRLRDVPRYLEAAERRLDKLGGAIPADLQKLAPILRLEAEYQELVGTLDVRRYTAELAKVRWMLEELRVSVFAQSLGTPQPISEARIRKVLDAHR